MPVAWMKIDAGTSTRKLWRCGTAPDLTLSFVDGIQTAAGYGCAHHNVRKNHRENKADRFAVFQWRDQRDRKRLGGQLQWWSINSNRLGSNFGEQTRCPLVNGTPNSYVVPIRSWRNDFHLFQGILIRAIECDVSRCRGSYWGGR